MFLKMTRLAGLWLAMLALAVQAETPSLLRQAEEIPDEFVDKLFDQPLASRVELDGKHLGDALLLLTREGTVQLLRFGDGGPDGDSVQQARWQTYFADPRPLGTCRDDCQFGLLSAHYSLENATLSLLSSQAEQAQYPSEYHLQPSGGSRGLIARNQLNIAGGSGGGSGRYAVDVSASLGYWTTTGGLLLSKSGGEDDRMQHSLSQLYAQREFAGHFLRLGYFSPDSQGMVLLPRTLDGMNGMTLGVMAGSSDTLNAGNDFPSSYPIYVTANRESVVEVMRNGMLLHSQTVATGLQLVNTRTLPEGIYPVEVRVMQDGVQLSSKEEWVYKPANWGNQGQRWRYNVFAGQQRSLLDNMDAATSGQSIVGGSINYLLHPRALLGMNAQHSGAQGGVGASLMLDLHQHLSISGNWFHSQRSGSGGDVQVHTPYSSGSLLLSLGQSRQWVFDAPAATTRNVALTWQQELGGQTSASVRLANSSGPGGGNGLDLALNRRQKIAGSDASIRVSMFDRPYGTAADAVRNRGVELAVSLNFDKSGRSFSGSIGSRSDGRGGRDQYATVSLRQRQEQSCLQQLALSASADRYGLGLNGSAQLAHPLAQGDAYLSRSSQGNSLSGGVNLESTLALNGDAIAWSGHGLSSGISTGMIVDVASDLPAQTVRAYDQDGGSFTLHPGRNLLPVNAYRAGNLSFFFARDDNPSANIHPMVAAYHLNKGGVGYAAIRVQKIVTVVGRLRDASGQPLPGAVLINHAGRTVSEDNGFFSVDISESQPELEVRQAGRRLCSYRLRPGEFRREGELLMVGDVVCVAGDASHQREMKAGNAN